MYAFRDAFEQRDSAKKLDERVDGERVISKRGSIKRKGADEASLKSNLTIDLTHLMNTIDLASAVCLDDLEYVKKSVLNYGIYDVAHLTAEEMGTQHIKNDLRKSLLANEPRIRPESLEIIQNKEFDDVNQRLRFDISAELYFKPIHIPIDFVAEIDVGSGKIQLSKMSSTS